MAEKEEFEISPAGSVRVGSDSPPGCHSLPTRSNPFFSFPDNKKRTKPEGWFFFLAEKEGFELLEKAH